MEFSTRDAAETLVARNYGCGGVSEQEGRDAGEVSNILTKQCTTVPRATWGVDVYVLSGPGTVPGRPAEW